MDYQNDLIEKYQGIVTKETDVFSGVPREVLNSSISIEAKGLYCFIIYNSSTSAKYKGRAALNCTTIDSIRKSVKWGNPTVAVANRKMIRQYLQELVDHNFIKIIEHNQIIDIVFPGLETFDSKGFAKLYPETVSKIVNATKGKTMLKRLVVYAQLRTLIFENSKDSRILEKSNNYLAKVLGMARSSVANNMQWMREHEVLAYFKCKMNRAIGYEKYYYADMVDCHVLTDIIKGYQKQGEVREIVE